MALYIPRSIFHFARFLYVRPETFGLTLVRSANCILYNFGYRQNILDFKSASVTW